MNSLKRHTSLPIDDSEKPIIVREHNRINWERTADGLKDLAKVSLTFALKQSEDEILEDSMTDPDQIIEGNLYLSIVALQEILEAFESLGMPREYSDRLRNFYATTTNGDDIIRRLSPDAKRMRERKLLLRSLKQN